MARAIEQIERDLAALSEAVSAIAVELKSTYTSYLEALEPATRQQLILASYQLCTQGYAKQFLSLSFSQRQQLQQAIRKLSQNASNQLLSLLKPETNEVESEELESSQETEDSELSSPLSSPSLLEIRCSNPIELAQWQQNLEEAIAHTLKTLSLETNLLLQQTGILPQKLPAPVLEAATNASETAADVTSGQPNLLNLLIEAENNSESQDSSVMQLIAIQLRLGEIEFADANVRSARNQIRQIEARLNLLGREYQKKQRERIVAEAESAWRSSWFDD